MDTKTNKKDLDDLKKKPRYDTSDYSPEEQEIISQARSEADAKRMFEEQFPGKRAPGGIRQKYYNLKRKRKDRAKDPTFGLNNQVKVRLVDHTIAEICEKVINGEFVMEHSGKLISISIKPIPAEEHE